MKDKNPRHQAIELRDFDKPKVPAALPSATGIQLGPSILPQHRLLLYSDKEWEEFIHEWAFYCLGPAYFKIQQVNGSGDKGIDVAAFTDDKLLLGVWDNYQCKHYDAPIAPTNAWPEFGKVLWHSYSGTYNPPRAYYFVAPKGIGTKLALLLSNHDRLKAQVIAKWDTHIASAIEKDKIHLQGPFRAYVDNFDFSIFSSKSALELVESHRTCVYHAARFGGGLPPRPAPSQPPSEIASTESKYISHLLAAYADHKKRPVPDAPTLRAWPPLKAHFDRQREAFYHAESLRVFARDTVPPGTFEGLQEDLYDGVIDTRNEAHEDGYARVKAVTSAAKNLQLTSNALVSCTRPKDRDGICHQLANEDKLKWTA